MNERRKRPDIFSEFLTLVPQRLNLGLGRRIGTDQAPDLPVRVPERHRHDTQVGGVPDMPEEGAELLTEG